MIVDYCSLLVCTILTEIIIKFFKDIILSCKKALGKKIIDEDIFQ